ncbi:hypothetical protein Cni_G26643 [Canna indica]|uniref:RNase H type-1 domain-containing protein n=1 Tax=Canna indica TaxID=4628 RepID=A0AAQ3QRI6_9LILI|nr:hypothetical protein Cni_G26643 [Canna indica]
MVDKVSSKIENWTCKNISQAGMGILIKDSMNRIIAVSSFSRSAASPFQAEAWAIWLGINGAKSLNLHNICLYSDCLNAINVLNLKIKAPWSLKDLFDDILDLAAEVNVLGWAHINKSQNKQAHKLAKLGSSSTAIEIEASGSQLASNQHNAQHIAPVQAHNFDGQIRCSLMMLYATNRLGQSNGSQPITSSLPNYERTPDLSEVYHESIPPDSYSCFPASQTSIAFFPHFESYDFLVDSRVKTRHFGY